MLRGLVLGCLAACASEAPTQPKTPPETPPAVASTVASAVASEAAPASVRNPGPDILVVVLDTLRADALQLYGAEGVSTPHLEALASKGLVFEDVTAPGSWTWPVHASLFTGEPPWVHGAHRAPLQPTTPVTGLRPTIPTVAEELARRSPLPVLIWKTGEAAE